MKLATFYTTSLYKWFVSHLEITAWIVALVVLFFMDEEGYRTSLCLFRFIGFERCPGCGLGHAIHAAFHLDFVKSIQYHPLGVPAIAIIFQRVLKLSLPVKTITYEARPDNVDSFSGTR